MSALYVNIFEYRMRAGADMDAYNELAMAMYSKVSGDPKFGFIGMKGFATSATEGVVIERFESRDGAMLWSKDPEHREIKRRAQREFYAWYHGSGCEVDHEYHHPNPIEDG